MASSSTTSPIRYRRHKRLIHAFPLRFFRYEVEHLLARSRFELVAAYGDYARSLPGDESPEAIFVAKVCPRRPVFHAQEEREQGAAGSIRSHTGRRFDCLESFARELHAWRAGITMTPKPGPYPRPIGTENKLARTASACGCRVGFASAHRPACSAALFQACDTSTCTVAIAGP